MNTVKTKSPLWLRMLFFIGVAGFVFNFYYWEKNFYKTYSKQKTDTKTEVVISHGNTYYVNADEYKTAQLVKWVTTATFCISIFSILIYKYKTQPGYFSSNKKRTT